MIGEALGLEIAAYAVEMRRTNPLFTKAQDGSMTVDQIANYLTNILHLVRHTPIYLSRARDRARVLGDERLAGHFQHKRGEEAGHDEWAEQDLERVSGQVLVAGARDVVPAIHELLDYLAVTIDEDPSLYLAYILFTEQITVLLGPEWLALLETRCGIPKTSLTVIDNHAELDKEHVEEALEEIDDLVGDPKKLAKLRDVVKTSIGYFHQFCIEVTRERKLAPHVSAA